MCMCACMCMYVCACGLSSPPPTPVYRIPTMVQRPGMHDPRPFNTAFHSLYNPHLPSLVSVPSYASQMNTVLSGSFKGSIREGSPWRGVSEQVLVFSFLKRTRGCLAQMLSKKPSRAKLHGSGFFCFLF